MVKLFHDKYPLDGNGAHVICLWNASPCFAVNREDILSINIFRPLPMKARAVEYFGTGGRLLIHTYIECVMSCYAQACKNYGIHTLVKFLLCIRFHFCQNIDGVLLRQSVKEVTHSRMNFLANKMKVCLTQGTNRASWQDEHVYYLSLVFETLKMWKLGAS